MSPISTAQLNPNGHTFCLARPGGSVLVPVLLNNTTPTGISYSLTPLGLSADGDHGKSERVHVSARDLKSIEQSRKDALQLLRPSASTQEVDEYDDDEDEDDEASSSNLQKTQSLTYLRITKPSTIRLVRVRDSSNVDARLAHPTQLVIGPCPMSEFVETADKDVHCSGSELDSELLIDIYGVPPLSLRWSKAINGRREHFMVEGIEGDHSAIDSYGEEKQRSVPQRAQTMRVPLTASLSAIGEHIYALEEVSDGIGNTVRMVEENLTGKRTKTVRPLTVLRRPSVSFSACSSEHPKALRIGEETPLAITTNEADPLDAPWDVTVRYQPLVEEGKKLHPWTKTLTTAGDRRVAILQVSAPGEYSILNIKGKWCEGDVMAPDSCKVVEQPKPTAEVEWKRIHEWFVAHNLSYLNLTFYSSGDTGVLASIALHGTPPFTVYYHTQRDKEHPRQETKKFNAFRGELSLQPERSGHYIYTIVSISDANYKKVELQDLPKIEQVVHPLAHAEFVGTSGGKKKVASCEGSNVKVEVALTASRLGIYDNGAIDKCCRGLGHGTFNFKSSAHKVRIPSMFLMYTILVKSLLWPYLKRLTPKEVTLKLT